MYFESIAYSFQSVSYRPLKNKPLSSFKKSAIKTNALLEIGVNFLLNVDTKIFSKTVASRFIPILPTNKSSDQTAYVKGRFIGESIRLISVILEFCKQENIEACVITADLEKELIWSNFY